MGALGRTGTRLLHWLRRGRRKDEIGEELETWVALTAEAKQAGGMSAADAWREARRELGGTEAVKERVYDASIGATLEILWRDARYAVRNVRTRPGFSLAIVLTVALAIGANAAIFTVVNGVLLKPAAAVDRPDGLVEVTGGDGMEYVDLSYPALTHFRTQSRALDDVAAFAPARMALDDARGVEVLWGLQTTGNYFSVLGVEPALGRFFAPAESFHPSTADVAVIGHELWQRRYEADPEVLGRTVRVNGHALAIVGVAAPDFDGHVPAFRFDVWVPLGTPAAGLFSAATLDDPGSNPLAGLGRLAPGVTPAQAQVELNLLMESFADRHLDGHGFPIRTEAYGPVPGMVRKPGAFFFGALMAIVGLVLAIACVNVANMLLSRGSDRSKEMAIRLALGAGRGRVVRQLLLETLVLFVLAGGAGLLLAIWATRLLLRLLPAIPVPVRFDLSPDWRVLTFAFGITLFAGLLSGVLPALRATRPDLVPALKGELLSSAPRGAGGQRLLVALQVTATIVLMICSGLFVRARFSAGEIDLGFRTHDVAVAQLDLELTGFTQEELRGFQRRLLEATGALPGVRSVGLSNKLPLASTSAMGGIRVDGVEAPTQYGFTVDFLLVAGDYHETVGIPLRAGRWIRDGDGPGTPRVAVINERMAARFWPEGNAVGKVFWSGPVGSGTPYEVVGVAADARYHGLIEDTPIFAYLPHAQHARPESASWGPTNVLLRTADGRTPGLASIRSLVREIDPSVPVLSVRPLERHIARYWFPQQVAAWVTGIVGAIGLLLGAIGIYGVTAYAVAQRRREIGIRMALGARGLDVVRAVVRGGMAAPAAGMLFGLILAMALTHILDRLLLAVSPLDPWTFGAVIVVLGSVALAANWIPARWAARVDPVSTLRSLDGR